MKGKYSAKHSFRRLWKKEKLMIFILLGVLLGTLVGSFTNKYVARLSEPTKTDAIIGVQFLGDMFLQCLRLILLPLIVSSLIKGMTGLDSKTASKLGLSAFIYYFGTTIISTILAVIFTLAIQPGVRANYNIVTDAEIIESRTLDSLLDILRNALPENIIQATFQIVKTKAKTQTIYENQKQFNLPPSFNEWSEENQKFLIDSYNIYNITENDDGTLSAWNATIRTVLLPDGTDFYNGINMLGIITFCIIFGTFLGNLGEKGEALLSVFDAIETITMKIINLIMWASPVGITSLIIGQLWRMDDISSAFTSLALYVSTVLICHFLQFFVVIFLIYFLCTRKNPFLFFKDMLKALVTAFACSSSSATIPVTLECLEENAKINKKISNFMIPVGATINMNGSAIYETVAALFLAQVYKIPLTAGNVFVIAVTATVTSMGVAGIPGGIITLVVVLQTVGIPPEALGLIISMDWLLDRTTTMVNVLGDAFGCGVVDGISKKYFPMLETDSSNEKDSCVECSAEELNNNED